MEREISNRIISIHDGFAISIGIIKEFAPNAYLNCVLLDLNKDISITKIKFFYYEKVSNHKGYHCYIVEIDNLKLTAWCPSEGFFPQKQIDELSHFDPLSYPPRKLDIEKVTIDIDQLVKIALNEPPHFILSELEHISTIDASLFVQDKNILWRFLCENSNIGFRTLHIDAEFGEIVFNKLDKINK